jgi:hypothetical protein
MLSDYSEIYRDISISISIYICELKFTVAISTIAKLYNKPKYSLIINA